MLRDLVAAQLGQALQEQSPAVTLTFTAPESRYPADSPLARQSNEREGPISRLMIGR